MNDDSISRQAAIDAFEDTTFTKNEIRRRLSEVPSAEPKKGKWIPSEKGIPDVGSCSNCGWTAYLYENDVIGMPYCPNCGAKMC